MTKEIKDAIIKEFARSSNDVGSSEVQIAILSYKIKSLTEHMKENRKDFSTRRGLIAMVNKRKKFLNYLNRKDHSKYLEICKKLNIRH